MEKTPKASADWEAHKHRRLTRLALWSAAYIAATLLATVGPHLLWQAKALTVLAILLSLGAGLGMLVANIRQLDTLDELMRKVQLEAMAIALGVGIIGGIAYSLLDTENVIRGDAQIGYLIILIGLMYLVAARAGYRRFQ